MFKESVIKYVQRGCYMIFLKKSTQMFSVGFLGLILIFTIFFPQRQVGQHYWENPFSLLMMTIILVSFFVGISILIKRVQSEKWIGTIITLLVISLIVIEIFLAIKFQGFGTTDPFAIWTQAERIAHGHSDWFPYFEIFSNNVPSVLILALLIDLATVLSIPHILFVNLTLFFLIDIVIFMLLSIIKKFGGKNSVVLALILCILFAPIYLVALNYYSDVLGLIFVFYAFYFFFRIESQSNHPFVSWFAGPLFGAMAVTIKPNLAFLIFGWIFFLALKNWKKGIKYALGVFLMLLVVSCFWGKVSGNFGYHSNSKLAYPIAGFVYMGMNKNLGGTYSVLDYEKPLKKINRNEGTVPKYLTQRMSALGVSGFLKLWLKKVRYLASTGDMNTLMWPSNFSKVPDGFIYHKETVIYVLENFIQSVYAVLIFLAIFGIPLIFKK